MAERPPNRQGIPGRDKMFILRYGVNDLEGSQTYTIYAANLDEAQNEADDFLSRNNRRYQISLKESYFRLITSIIVLFAVGGWLGSYFGLY